MATIITFLIVAVSHSSSLCTDKLTMMSIPANKLGNISQATHPRRHEDATVRRQNTWSDRQSLAACGLDS
jgi:hypothetical protein